jgi:[calcium/calmodulin-dependent protein kinase] kinase
MKIINVRKMKRTMMSRTTTGVDNVEKEIEIMKKINSPYCVKLEEVIGDDEDDQVYIALEYIKKGSLEFIKNNTKLTEKQICNYFRQTVLGIEYLHSIGIIHRDIKPDNLLIGEDDNLKISDFGISDIAKGADDMRKNTAGTNYFFCPESCLGKPYSGKKADIWALGVTLYNLLTDKYPFNGKTHVELNTQITDTEPEYYPSWDTSLIQLLKGLLDKDPSKRYDFGQIRSNKWMTNNDNMPLPSMNN